jgi:hypothetical protein
LGLVVNLDGLELTEKLIHGEGVIVHGLNDSGHLHILLSQTQEAKDSRKGHYELYYLRYADPSAPEWYEHEVQAQRK